LVLIGVCCISGVIIGKSAAIPDPDYKFNIMADHPFVFFIADDINSLPLFSGWVVQL
jgi:Serpin (serine protease inhibitor).